MKKVIWLIVFSLITFTLLGQKQELKVEQKNYWEVNSPKFNIEKPLIIDTTNYCKPTPKTTSNKTYTLNNKDLCINDVNKTKPLSDYNWGNEVSVKLQPQYKYRHNYIYNFKGHISLSVGVKLADIYPSKIRLEWESDTKTQNFTVGGLLSIYTLKYYYNGWRIEAFTRYYFVPNTSGEGGFLQFRIGTSKFQNPITKNSFVSSGVGLDVGNKFILVGNKTNYKNAFTLTPMGGIQIYNGPDGETPISWVWQLRFGYQF
jgi:hypothetical protein